MVNSKRVHIFLELLNRTVYFFIFKFLLSVFSCFCGRDKTGNDDSESDEESLESGSSCRQPNNVSIPLSSSSSIGLYDFKSKARRQRQAKAKKICLLLVGIIVVYCKSG